MSGMSGRRRASCKVFFDPDIRGMSGRCPSCKVFFDPDVRVLDAKWRSWGGAREELRRS